MQKGGASDLPFFNKNMRLFAEKENIMLEKVSKLIAEQLGIDPASVKPESDLIGDLKADSLDIVQMLMTMEQEFGVEFDDVEILGLKTVGDVVRFLESRA